MATAMELDPDLLQALGFFLSTSSDSSEQLKKMLDEAIHSSKRSSESKDSGMQPSRLGSKLSKSSMLNSEQKKKDKEVAQKRQLDKIKLELDEINQEVKKKPYFDNPHISGKSSTPLDGGLLSKHQSSSSETITQTNGVFVKNSPSITTSTEDFALEMAALACVMCKEMTVGSGNQLIECQECHNLYHKDCHQPRVSDSEVNDPRCIWYCAKCKQSLKKQEKQNIAPPPLTPHSISIPLDGFREKGAENKSKTSAMLFKRSEIKPTLSTSSNGGGSMSGWAALSGKAPSSSNKFNNHSSKSIDIKSELSSHKSSLFKDKPKLQKNHSKNAQAKLGVCDAWAEALDAKPTSNEKLKASNKVSANSNAKQISLSSVPWLTNPGSNSPGKHKSPNHNLTSHKSAPFPKASAATGSIAKSSTTHDSANKHLQMMKKKASAKMQQKRTRV